MILAGQRTSAPSPSSTAPGCSTATVASGSCNDITADLAHLNRSSSQRYGPRERRISVAPGNRPTRVDGRLWTGGAADGRVGPSSRDGPPLGPERNHAVAVAGLAVMASAGVGWWLRCGLLGPAGSRWQAAGRQDPYLQVAADEGRWTIRRLDTPTHPDRPAVVPAEKVLAEQGRAHVGCWQGHRVRCLGQRNYLRDPRRAAVVHTSTSSPASPPTPPSPQISCLTGSQGGP